MNIQDLWIKVTIAISIAASLSFADHEHQGFLFRYNLGLAHINDEVTTDMGTGQFTGTALASMVSVGASLNAHWSLGLELNGASTRNISIDNNHTGSTWPGLSTLTNASLGPMVSYNIMPANVYLTGSLGFADVRNSSTVSKGASALASPTETVSAKSKAALDLSLSAGKEWYVSKCWGLGVAVNLQLIGKAKDFADNAAMSASGSTFSLLFSATYN